MSKLRPTNDARTSYDPKNGALRSFFGAELVESPPPAKRGLTVAAKSDDFLKVNGDLFKLQDVSLRKTDVKEGAASRSVRYEQQHNGVPVYRSSIVVGQRKRDGIVTCAQNSVDYDLPPSLGSEQAKLTAQDVQEILRKRFDGQCGGITLSDPVLFVYRHTVSSEPERPPIHPDMLRLATGQPDNVYLVWQVFMDTRTPSGEWELMVDATSGELVAVKDRQLAATRQAYVFSPDPVRSKQDDSLSWSTAEATLNDERFDVDLQNLDAPVGGTYKLTGTWVESVDLSEPDFTPPTTTGDFKYGAKQNAFLSVMAYYYLDSLITYLRSLGCSQFNSASAKVKVDAQGRTDDNSSSSLDSSGNLVVRLGIGGVPDAADPAVAVHEYGHSVYRVMGIGTSSPYSYEQGWCDLLAAVWLDRFNEHQYQREEVFPWDNCPAVHWDPKRRLDRTERFDDAGFSGYGHDLRGSIYATALWDWFLNIGGSSPNPDVRKWAADHVVSTYLEMLVFLDTHESQKENYVNLANALIAADYNLTGGLFRKVIWDAFRRRGAWQDFTPAGNVDLYVRDSESDTGEHASPAVHWTSPDIWIRNNPPPANPGDPNDPNYGEDPEAGHQSPINDVPNYLYVRVRNRGSQAATANAFTLEAFHCNPATAMLWPDNFESMGILTIDQNVPANGGSVRVGPFIWTPEIVDHECLLAVVRGTADPTVADDVEAKGSVDHWKIVRFDNNVGQRNVQPSNSTPGGKTKTSFLVRGTNHPTVNTLSLDATALPSDTQIAVRVARSLVDGAASLSGFTVTGTNNLWTNLALTGGETGSISGFPLATNEKRSVYLEIDFSYEAENLKRYPIIARQDQDGMVAGQITIEITAVKDSADYIYGNRATHELHKLECEFRKKMSAHNQVPFLSVKEGIARGYNGCRFCLPEYDTD